MCASFFGHPLTVYQFLVYGQLSLWCNVYILNAIICIYLSCFSKLYTNNKNIRNAMMYLNIGN